MMDAVRLYIPNLSDFVEKKFLEFLSYVNHPLAGNIEIRRGWDLNPGALNGHRLSRPAQCLSATPAFA